MSATSHSDKPSTPGGKRGRAWYVERYGEWRATVLYGPSIDTPAGIGDVRLSASTGATP